MAPASQPPDQVINGVSQLVTVAPTPAATARAIAAQQLSLSINLPQDLSTCFSAADFLEAVRPRRRAGVRAQQLARQSRDLQSAAGARRQRFQRLSARRSPSPSASAPFAIVDPPPQAPAFGSSIATPQPVRVTGWRAWAAPAGPRCRASQNGAVYYPYLISQRPVTGNNIPMAPSGFVAGLYAQTDTNRGVWKAPAGLATVVQNTHRPGA